MIETKTKEIDGLTFMSTQLPPLKAYPLSARVANILLPTISRWVGSDLADRDVDEFLAQDAQKILPMLEPLLDALGKKENEDLPQKLLAGTSVQIPDDNGQATVVSLATPEGINKAFQGRAFTLYKAMWFAVEVNFRDFFGGASKIIPTKGSAVEAKANV